MVDHPYEGLEDAPVIRGHVYQYGPRGGSPNSPYSRLLKVSNSGGIRIRKTSDDKFAFVLLTSSLKSKWKDEFDPNTGVLLYHGDNNDTSLENLKTGNDALTKIFNAYSEGKEPVPLLYFKTRGKQGNSPAGVEFVGLFVSAKRMDGSPYYDRYSYEQEGETLWNYVYHMKLLDTRDEDIKDWLFSRVDGSPSAADMAPEEWKRMLRGGVFMSDEIRGADESNTGNKGVGGKEPGGSFFDYLESEGLLYPKETVENFLLSIKAKPFLILTGGSGTGKTKLAQLYGRFLTD